MDCSLPGSSVHGISQARILEWVAISSSRGSSRSRDWTHVSCIPCIAGRFFIHWATWEALDSIEVKWREVTQSCPTLCDPMDCSLPGSSVHGIFQAIVLEWIAISFSKGSSQSRDRTRVSRIVDRRFTVWAAKNKRLTPEESTVCISDIFGHSCQFFVFTSLSGLH